MAAMFGADTARLREVGGAADAAAEALREIGARVVAEVEAVDWIGPDADGYRDDVAATVGAELDALSARLADDARDLLRQADEQDAASAASSAATRAGAPSIGAERPGGPEGGGGATALGPERIAALERASGHPEAVAALLRDVPRAELARLATERPELVGPLGGAPYWARDLANRRLLDAALDSGAGSAKYRDDLVAIDRVLASTPGASLAELDLGTPGRAFAAIGLGDLDTAPNVAFVVPGISNRASNGMAPLTEAAMNVRDEVALAGSGRLDDVATVAWMGYDSGGIGTVAFNDLANEGARRLETSLNGFTAARPDTTVELGVVGHSYGATTTALALSDGGQHGVDRFIAMGPAGFVHTSDANGAWPGGRRIAPADFGSTQVWTTEARADHTADIGRIISGRLDPAGHGFTTFSAEADTSGHLATTGHGIGSGGDRVGYLGPGSTSLYHIGRILNGLE